jgi:hypothetical protein
MINTYKTSTVTNPTTNVKLDKVEIRNTRNGNFVGIANEITAGGSWVAFNHNDKMIDTFAGRRLAVEAVESAHKDLLATRPF